MNVYVCVYECVFVSAGCKCSICVSMWVYTCVCGCVCGVCAYVCTGVHDHVCALSRGGHPVSCSIILHLILLREGLSLNLELGWLPTIPSSPTTSLLFPSLSALSYRCTQTGSFWWGIPAQTLMTVQTALLPTGLSPSEGW